MKFVKYDGTDERLAVSALCLDTAVLSAIAPTLPANPFPSQWANTVTKWATDHFTQFGECPGAQGITARYTQWAESADTAVAEIVHKWLTGLEPSTLTPGYAIEMIGKLVQKTSVTRLRDQITNSIDRGVPDAAVSAVEAWVKPVLGSVADDGVYLLEDEDAVRQAFHTVQQEPLITLPGALGELMNPNFIPNALVGLLAPNKSGKSAWLLHLAWKAVTQGRRTVFFSLGDMTQAQIINRLLPKVCRCPRHPGTYRIPTKVEYKDKEPSVEFSIRQSGTGVTEEMAVKAFSAFRGENGKRFRLVTHPAGSYSAFDLANQLERWAQSGWLPEVVVLDYADILNHPQGGSELRHKINATWTELRAISSRMDCLIVVATQSDTAGFGRWLLGKENFNECRRILDHCSSFFGLNTTEQERKLNLCRINPIAIREAEYLNDYTGSCVVSAGCYRLQAPNILSGWL